jgi:hypothetical protein
MAGVVFPVGASDFSQFHSTQTGSGVHLASYPTEPGALSPGVKRQGREANQLPPSSAEIKNGGAIPQLTHTSSWRSA